MYDIINRFIDKMSTNDIKDFALKNNINLSDDETKFIYMFLKKNWQELLGNPNSLIMDHYRNEFSDENFNKINNLVEYYRGQYSGYLKR